MAGSVRLVVPAYFHPAVAPDDWAALAALGGRVRLVVLNVADGPGERCDPAFLPVLDALPGDVAGYVDTDYGRRPGAAIEADITRYRRWYPQARSVFFDRVAAGADLVGHYADLARAARATGVDAVVFHHGVHPDPGYAEHADLLGTFEGPWSAYRTLDVPVWARGDRFLHLVHTVPPRSLPAARRRAAYATDLGGSNPWRHLRV